MLPVPGLALGPHHRGALVDPAQRLAEVAAAAHERDLEGVLVDVVALVGRGEDLGLVDVVDAERLEDLGLDEVADARLGHDRDGHGVHDPLDHRGVGHAGDAAGRADVGRDALERHHGDGAGILGDLGLIGRDDIHDDAALEHLGETGLGGPGGRFDGHVNWVPLMARARIAGRVWPRGRRPFESAEPLARGDYRTSANKVQRSVPAQAARPGTAGTGRDPDRDRGGGGIIFFGWEGGGGGGGGGGGFVWGGRGGRGPDEAGSRCSLRDPAAAATATATPTACDRDSLGRTRSRPILLRLIRMGPSVRGGA